MNRFAASKIKQAILETRLPIQYKKIALHHAINYLRENPNSSCYSDFYYPHYRFQIEIRHDAETQEIYLSVAAKELSEDGRWQLWEMIAAVVLNVEDIVPRKLAC